MQARISIIRSTAVVSLLTLVVLLLLQMGGVALFPALSRDGVGILPVIAATLGAAAATYMLRRREYRRSTDVAFLRESQAYFRTIAMDVSDAVIAADHDYRVVFWNCLLYTSPSPRDRQTSRMPSSALKKKMH